MQKSSDVTSNEYRSYPSDGRYLQFPGQGPYPGFQPGSVPPGQFPGFTQPGPGFSPPPGQPYYPGPGPVGPSPECFAAIQSGDFVKAKAVCETHTPQQPYPTGPVCPVSSAYVECPAGQYRESFRNNDGCWVDGACKSSPTYSPYPTFTPSGDPAVDCQKSGGTWDSAAKYCKFPTQTYSPYPTGSPGPYPTYSPGSESNWINKTWKFKDGSTQSSSILNRTDSEYAGHINSVYNSCSTKYFNGWKPGGGDQSNWKEFGIPVCSDTVSTSPSPYPTYSPGISPTYSPYPTTTGGTGEMYSCFYPNATKNGASPGYTVWCEKDYFNCHEGSKTGPSISLEGLALGAPSSCESGYYGQSCNNNNFCDSNETSSSCPNDCGGATYSPTPGPGTGGCPSGYHYHSESGGFCINDQENFGGTCYNSAGTSKITCPAQPTYSPSPTTSSCSQSLINLLGTGCHWMYSDSSGRGIYCDSSMTKSAKEGDSATTSGCSSGSGTYTPAPTYSPGTSYTPYPTCPSGQWWDPAINACKSTTTSDTPYPSPSYSGYCGDNVCANGETSSSCPSDCGGGTTYTPYPTITTTTSTYTPPPSCSSNQYWNGSSCVTNPTPYPTTEYTPPPTYSEPPPPTSGLYPHYLVIHCQQLGRTWNGKVCEANGLFARFFEGSGMANALRLFYIIP